MITDVEFYLKEDGYERAIEYRAKTGPHQHLRSRLFFLPMGGMTDGDHAIPLAKKVVEYLNSLPIEERCLYPHNR